jgi:hypothetical protein
MADRYVAPKKGEGAFHCPACGVYANQTWGSLSFYLGSSDVLPGDWRAAYCSHCGQSSLWKNDQLWYPSSATAPLPNPDLPPQIHDLYEEAREISSKSSRGAAALLRLAVQMLTIHLCGLYHEEVTDNLNKDIGTLVKHGLPKSVQQALDAVRVIGNNAVHPGQIDIGDDHRMTDSLFGLVNFIAEKTITEQKEIDAIYASLPEGTKQQIDKRDERS